MTGFMVPKLEFLSWRESTINFRFQSTKELVSETSTAL